MNSMEDKIFGKVVSDLDAFKKLLTSIPGFQGYIERQKRRDADKLLRETIANRFEEQWQRISTLQRDFINQGEITYLDDLESAAIKIRTLIDRLRRAPRGYSGLFDAVKVNEKELAKIYEYDATLTDFAESVSRAIDNVEASMGSDGLPAAIRNVSTIATQCIEVYNQRSEVVFGEAG